MRPIKFRGKRKDNGEWIYGDLVHNTWGYFIINHFAIHNDKIVSVIEAEVIPETIGQFTGLHDKNGKEIYEGDIVETNYGKSIIEWNLKTARWEQQLFHSSLDSERCSLMDWNKGIKVIGNVHERSEK